jgi:hypothetical protein
MFLTDTELARLTGRKTKSKQIAWLRAEGLPFRISATGHPVVTRAAVEGRRDAALAPQPAWRPRVVGA